MGDHVLQARGDAQCGQSQETSDEQEGLGAVGTEVESDKIECRASVRQALWEAHMKSPTAALEEALRRTEDEAGRAQSSFFGGVSVELNFVFDENLLFRAKDMPDDAAFSCSPCKDGLRLWGQGMWRETCSGITQWCELVATCRVARLTLQTRTLWLVGGCRDRPSRALPLTCPNVQTFEERRTWTETQEKMWENEKKRKRKTW